MVAASDRSEAMRLAPSPAFLTVLVGLAAGFAASAASPEQVISVTPAAGASSGPRPGIEAVLDLSRGPPIDLGSLRVLVDGVDLAQQCAFAASRDVPPSRVEIRCPGIDLAPGVHEAKLTSTLASGGAFSYDWAFRVVGP